MHGLDQWNRLVNGLGPAFNLPRLFPTDFALFQVRKLPQVVHRVQVANLHEPCAHTFHHLPTSCEATSPVRLPFEEVSGVKSVRSELEDTSQAAGWGRGPEREFLHEGCFLALDQLLQLAVEFGELRVLRDAMQ